MSELAFVSLGSNIEPERNLPAAVPRLEDLGRLMALSSVYESMPWGGRDQPSYLNAAALIETELSAETIRTELRRIEKELGRARTADRYASRSIDLDLCLLGSAQVSTDDLTLPDPDVTTRAYLARTLADLAPSFRYPGSGETLDSIAERLGDGAELILRHDVTTAIERAVSGVGPAR